MNLRAFFPILQCPAQDRDMLSKIRFFDKGIRPDLSAAVRPFSSSRPRFSTMTRSKRRDAFGGRWTGALAAQVTGAPKGFR
jgi:hypothetical protein